MNFILAQADVQKRQEQLLDNQREMLKGQQDYKSVEVQVNAERESFGFNDAVQAVNAGSFAVLVVFGVIFWQLRGQFCRAMDHHIELLDTMREAIKVNTQSLEALRKTDDITTVTLIKLVDVVDDSQEDITELKAQSKEALSILYRLAATNKHLDDHLKPKI